MPIKDTSAVSLNSWIARWSDRLDAQPESREAIGEDMDAHNPIFIPRNHKVEEALEAAIAGDLEPVRTLLQVLRDPFTESAEFASYALPATQSFTSCFRTFCGT